MVNEKLILSAAIKSREAWKLIDSHVTTAEIGTDTATILSLVKDYYSRDSTAQLVDIGLIIGGLDRAFSNPKHTAALTTVLQNLPDTSPENVAAEILALKRHNVGLKLANALMTSGNSKEGLNGSKKLLGEYQKLLEATDLSDGQTENEEVIEHFTVQDLVQRAFDPVGLIPLFPTQLNEFIGGGVRGGNHVFIFAPTEMGKTLLAIDNLAGWAERGIKTVYVGNEDPIEDIQMRFITRVVKRPKADILAKPDVAQKLLEKRGYENIIFAPLAPGTFETIERLVDRIQPKVVVLDQLHNIDVDSEVGVQAKETQSTRARNLAKSRNLLVVSISQAADSATGKRILTRGDVYGSNVGIPGQLDLMIGFSGTEEDEQSNIRWLSFPKNKINGNHGTFQVEINPQLSMVVE